MLAPATDLMRRAFAEPGIVKGIICHGLWIMSRVPELVRGRRLVCHPNLYGDALNMGAEYIDSDVVVDADLVTARSGAQAGVFARTIIEQLAQRPPADRTAAEAGRTPEPAGARRGGRS